MYRDPPQSPARLVLLALLQMAIMGAIDVACVYSELSQGIPLLNVWRGRHRAHIARDVLQFALAGFVVLVAFHVTPYWGQCGDAEDVCSCGFAEALPAVAEHCGWGVDGSEEEDGMAAFVALSCAATGHHTELLPELLRACEVMG